MRLTTSLAADIPPILLDIASTLREAGGRLLIVGGFVRDHALRAPTSSKDIDCEVFNLESGALQTLLSQYGSVNAVGMSFGVYKLHVEDFSFDFSIPRRDSKSGTGHRAFDVVGDPTMSIEDAARRRDFTINAMSYDPLTHEFIDPFSGILDLRMRILRAVDQPLFIDDSLRVLRAVQFAARFDFSLEPETFYLCESIRLSDLPAERIWTEFEKLLRSPRPSIGLRLARDLGIVQRLWPELAATFDVPQDPTWHPEGDVWTHTLQVVDLARRELNASPLPLAQDLTVMLAALCHDFGKPSTTTLSTIGDETRYRAHGHEEAGVAPTAAFLDRLNIHSLDGYDVYQHVLSLVENHLAPFAFFKADPGNGAFRRLARKVDLLLLARLAFADGGGRHPKVHNPEAITWFLDRVAKLDLRTGPPPSILMGRHLLALGLRPGPQIGEIIKAVYELQLDGKISDLNEALRAATVIGKIGEIASPVEQP
jgi:tRNA nucleotidyltransferase (CCA-adding enzyme)